MPNRLSYPELFDLDSRSNLFYNNKKELKDKIVDSVLNFKNNDNLSNVMVQKFDWSYIVKEYDSTFESLID